MSKFMWDPTDFTMQKAGPTAKSFAAFLEKAGRVKKPGSRGGKGYYDDQGQWQYGERPPGRPAAALEDFAPGAKLPAGFVYHNLGAEALAAIEQEGMNAGSFADRPIDFGGDRWVAVRMTDLPRVQSHQYGEAMAHEPGWERELDAAGNPVLDVVAPHLLYEVDKRGRVKRKLAASPPARTPLWEMTEAEWDALPRDVQQQYNEAGNPPYTYHSNFYVTQLLYAARAGQTIPWRVWSALPYTTQGHIWGAAEDRLQVEPGPQAAQVAEALAAQAQALDVAQEAVRRLPNYREDMDRAERRAWQDQRFPADQALYAAYDAIVKHGKFVTRNGIPPDYAANRKLSDRYNRLLHQFQRKERGTTKKAGLVVTLRKGQRKGHYRTLASGKRVWVGPAQTKKTAAAKPAPKGRKQAAAPEPSPQRKPGQIRPAPPKSKAANRPGLGGYAARLADWERAGFSQAAFSIEPDYAKPLTDALKAAGIGYHLVYSGTKPYRRGSLWVEREDRERAMQAIAGLPHDWWGAMQQQREAEGRPPARNERFGSAAQKGGFADFLEKAQRKGYWRTEADGKRVWVRATQTRQPAKKTAPQKTTTRTPAKKTAPQKKAASTGGLPPIKGAREISRIPIVPEPPLPDTGLRSAKAREHLAQAVKLQQQALAAGSSNDRALRDRADAFVQAAVMEELGGPLRERGAHLSLVAQSGTSSYNGVWLYAIGFNGCRGRFTEDEVDYRGRITQAIKMVGPNLDMDFVLDPEAYAQTGEKEGLYGQSIKAAFGLGLGKKMGLAKAVAIVRHAMEMSPNILRYISGSGGSWEPLANPAAKVQPAGGQRMAVYRKRRELCRQGFEQMINRRPDAADYAPLWRDAVFNKAMPDFAWASEAALNYSERQGRCLGLTGHKLEDLRYQATYSRHKKGRQEAEELLTMLGEEVPPWTPKKGRYAKKQED